MPQPMPGVSKKPFWCGWILGVLPMPLFAMSAAMKFLMPPEAAEGFKKLDWPISTALPLGIVELACCIIYLIPRTAVLGAILLTGYLGGAIATHVRAQEPFWIPALIGIVLWIGLYLRDPRLRALAPIRTV